MNGINNGIFSYSSSNIIIAYKIIRNKIEHKKMSTKSSLTRYSFNK